MQDNQIETNKKPVKKLFGVKNPILKALIILVFFALMGRLGLVVAPILLLAFVCDRYIAKRKSRAKQVAEGSSGEAV